MATGQLLEPGALFAVDAMYGYFVQYFSNPIMTKIKDINNHSMYMVKTNAILGIEYRYIIAFVYKDGYPIGTTEYLEKLPWVSLQTRTLAEDHKLPIHSYIPRRLPVLDYKIKLIHKDAKQYVYNVAELPIQIILLPKRNDYNANGDVITALETYQTIVSLKND